MKKILTISLFSLTLLGCSKPAVIPSQNTEIKLIRLTQAQQQRLSNKQVQVLANANEDIRLILQGGKPKNAKIHVGIPDGGTLWYKCDDYDIWSWKALGFFMGHDGYTRGVTIKFSKAVFWGNMEDLSYTWFESF